MESESSQRKTMTGILPILTPVLLISISYIDPGKWVASIDTGARFGVDLAVFALAFNFVAVLCHYLTARVTVITGKNLSQICSEEYDKLTCIFLGIQMELSVIALDLTMIHHSLLLRVIIHWDQFEVPPAMKLFLQLLKPQNQLHHLLLLLLLHSLLPAKPSSSQPKI